MRYLMTAGALALSLVSSATLAETAQPSGQTTQPPLKQMQTQTAQAGMQEATPSTMTVKFLNVQPADVMAYDLLGMDVYNNQDENIGEIEDMVIDNGKTVRALIISAGGFLGMGEGGDLGSNRLRFFVLIFNVLKDVVLKVVLLRHQPAFPAGTKCL